MGEDLDRVSEMLSLFRPEAVKELLSLPPDQIENAFYSSLANTIGISSSLYQIKTEIELDEKTTGFAYPDHLIARFGKENKRTPRNPEAKLFMSMVEMAAPLVKAYTGYKKAYGEEENMPFFKEYAGLNFGSRVLPYADTYRALKGFGELVRRLDKPEEYYKEVILPLMENPLVDREQVFMGLLACVDTPAVVASRFKPGDLSQKWFWTDVAFDGPKRSKNLDEILDSGFSYPYMRQIVEHAPEIERKMRKTLSVMSTNIEAVSALPTVSGILKTYPSEIEEIRGSNEWFTKPFVEFFHTRAILPEIDRFQTVLSQEQLKTLDQALRDNFLPEIMTKKKIEKAVIFINRAIGLAHLPPDKFTFAIPLMLHEYKIQHTRENGNFGDVIFSDAVLDTLYERREAFKNLPVDSFIDFWEGVNVNQDNFNAATPIGELEIEKLSRALDIWQTVGEKPKEYQDLFLKQSASSPPNKWKDYAWYTDTEIDLAELPAHIRPYVLYYREGDLAEKSQAIPENVTFPWDVRLSHLNLARRLQVEDYKVAIGQSDKLVEVIETATRGKDSFVAQRELLHAVEHLPAVDPYLFLRELIQNSQDAALHDKSGVHQQIAVHDYRRQGQYVVEISDTVGMNAQTVFSSLLPVGESTKGTGDRGRFGIGFLSILKGANRVEISTADGQNEINIQLQPVADADGSIIDYQLSWDTASSERKGTTIRKYTNDAEYAMESAFLHDAMIRYGTFIDTRNVNVLFRDNQINREKTVLSERIVPGLGKIELLDGNETALLQGDLYVTQLPEYMKAMIPESIRSLALEQGLVLNLDTTIELVRTRSDIAHRDTYTPLLSKIMSGMVVESVLKKYATGKVDLATIPYDYFWADGAAATVWKRRISQQTEEDARAINAGEIVDHPERYFQKEALLELLTVVECVTVDGKRRSLRDIAVMADEGYKFNDIDILPKRVAGLIKEREDRGKRVVEERRIFEEQKSQEVEFVPSLKDMEILRRESDVHLAFLDLIERITPPELRESVKRGYYSIPNGSAAHASLQDSVKGWNLLHSDKNFGTLQKLLKGETTSASEINDFWYHVANASTHEDVHFLFKLESWTHHHNELFYEMQTKLLSGLLRIDLGSIIADLRTQYKGTRLSTPELLVRLGYIKSA